EIPTEAPGREREIGDPASGFELDARVHPLAERVRHLVDLDAIGGRRSSAWALRPHLNLNGNLRSEDHHMLEAARPWNRPVAAQQFLRWRRAGAPAARDARQNNGNYRNFRRTHASPGAWGSS